MPRIKNWPKSLPDYAWPHRFDSRKMRAIGLALTVVFHAAHAVGRFLGFALRRLLNYQARPTLVIRTDGIGDALLFEPALESLARRMSPSEIHLWAPAATCELFKECPTITRRMTVPRGGKDGNFLCFSSIGCRAKLGFELGFWQFEKVIYPVQSPEPLGNWLFSSARTEERWLNFGDTDNQFDWQQAKTQEEATRVLEVRPGSAHELARNAYLADQWSPGMRLRKPRVHLNFDAARDADRIVAAWRRAADRLGGSDMVGVVVGSASAAKQYPADQWAETIIRLWQDHKAIAILLGAKSDAPKMDEVASQLASVPHFRLLEPVDLLTMSGIIRHLDAMLAIDTGAAHIALSMRVPTVVLVGGGHPGRFFPWPNAAHHVALNVAMSCDGCKNRCHLAGPECITQIKPDEIIEAYMKLRTPNTDTAITPFIMPAVAEEEEQQAVRKKKKRKAAG